MQGQPILQIDINNPFFNCLSKSYLMNGFSLNINYDTFKNKNLIKDINNFFMKLEEYPQIQFFFLKMTLSKLNY